ncbi:MAG TPA: hypothetical protein VH877_09420 [Polyangia bacterium]|nr:hypothetical protein [Polyangia bacterium]
MRKLLLCAVLVCSCNPVNNPTPTRSLDRPSDVALVCAVKAVNGDPVLAPLSVCDYSAHTSYNLNTPATAPNKFLTLSDNTQAKGQLFAFVSNTTRGEVALVANGTLEFATGTENQQNKALVRQVVPLSRDAKVAPNLGASIVDLDNASPGYGFIPVGGNPERIRTTADGCVAMTANTDTCDLAVIDVQALLGKLNGQALGASTVLNAVRRIQPRARGVGSVPGAPLRARPTWIEFTTDTTGLGTKTNAGGSPIGNQCTDAATADYKAFVAFPGCGLVGEVNLKTGELVDALQLTPTGAVRVAPEDVRCPAECGSGAADGGAGAAPDLTTAADDAGNAGADGAAARGGLGDGLPPQLAAGGVYPRTLAVDGEGQLYIGDAARDVITVVSLDAASNFGAVRQIPLEAAGGVTVVRLSPRVFDLLDPPTQGGTGYPGAKYLYAIARDRTVRVIDVDLGYECETNPDGRTLNERYPIFNESGGALSFRTEDQAGRNQGQPRLPNRLQQTLRCLPIGQIPRSPLSRSPGILLPGGTVPRDIAFTHGPIPPDSTDANVTPSSANPLLTAGDYAWLIGSSGQMVVVSLFDDCPQPNVPQSGSLRACVFNDPDAVTQLPKTYLSSVTTAYAYTGRPLPEPIELLPNRIRNRNPRFIKPGEDPGAPDNGAARLAQDQLNIGGSPVEIYQTSTPYLCDFGTTSTGQQMYLDRCANNIVDQGQGTVRFTDSSAVRLETWTLEWEGAEQSLRPSGVISSGALADIGAGFCSRGIRPGDKVDLTGCSTDVDCRPWQQCYRDAAAPIQNPGLCLTRDPLAYQRAQELCQPWTRAVRRYRIREARADRLALEEIMEPESPLNTHTCSVLGDTTECNDVKVLVRSNSATVSLPTTCLPDGAGVYRCLRGCRVGATDTEGLCGPGFVCATSQSGRDQCLRAPLPQDNLPCFTEAQDYLVRVGDAFRVSGEVSQSLEEGQVDSATGLCVQSTDPAQRYLQSRVPLDDRLVDCPPDVKADWLAPLTNLPAGNYSNVCRLAGPAPCTQNSDCGTGGTCLLESRTCLGDTIVRFSNPVFDTAIVVPIRPLLSSATGSGVPVTYNRIPAIAAQVNFRSTGGYGPLSFLPTGSIAPQLPRAITLGPDRQTLYIVDEGRENVATGRRGQLLRFFGGGKNSDTNFIIQ